MGVQIGDEKTFLGTLTKSGSTWPVPLASAVFRFVRPDGSSFEEDGTVVDGTTALVSYTTENTVVDGEVVYEIDSAGFWRIFVITTDDDGNRLTMEEPFTFDVAGVN